MPDLLTVTRYTCPDNIWAGTSIKSSGSDRNYNVSCEGSTFDCECAGFMFRGTCRHVKEFSKTLCGEHIEAFMGDGPTQPGLCVCGRELVPISVGV